MSESPIETQYGRGKRRKPDSIRILDNSDIVQKPHEEPKPELLYDLSSSKIKIVKEKPVLPDQATLDTSFPSAEVSVPKQAKFPTTEKVPENFSVRNIQTFADLLIFTGVSGRNSIKIAPEIIQGEIFMAEIEKGNGSFDAYTETGSHFSREDTRSKTVRGTDAGYASGYLTKSEAYLDASISLLVQEQTGARVRVPTKGYYLDTIEVDGKNYTSDEFVKEFAANNQDERPYVAKYAMRYPFRVAELTNFAYEVTSDNNLASIDFALRVAIISCAQDSEEEFNKIGIKWLNKAHSKLDESQIVELFEEISRAYMKVLGKNLALIHNSNRVHNNLHIQNTSMLSEIADWVTSQKVAENSPEIDAEKTKVANEHSFELFSALDLLAKKLGISAIFSRDTFRDLFIEEYNKNRITN